jgi:DNA helicase-2/ATP-dependent DNA helicase PcrA
MSGGRDTAWGSRSGPKDHGMSYGEGGVSGPNPRARSDVSAKADRYAAESARKAGMDEYSQVPPDEDAYDTPARDTPREGFGGRMDRSHNQAPRRGAGLYSSAKSGGPREIQGELVAKSVMAEESRFSVGDRVFHLKFGPGSVVAVEGNKLTVDFDKAGQKRVLEGFLQAA